LVSTSDLCALSLHDALPISCSLFYKEFETQYPDVASYLKQFGIRIEYPLTAMHFPDEEEAFKHEYLVYYCVKGKLPADKMNDQIDRKSTRLNSSHVSTSYAV